MYKKRLDFHAHAESLFDRLIAANGVPVARFTPEYSEAVKSICGGTIIAQRWDDTFERAPGGVARRLATQATARAIRDAFAHANVEGRLELRGKAPLFGSEELQKLVDLAKAAQASKRIGMPLSGQGDRNLGQSLQFIERLNTRLQSGSVSPYKVGSNADRTELPELVRFAYEQIHEQRAAGRLKHAWRVFSVTKYLFHHKMNPFKLNLDERLQGSGMLAGMGNFLFRSLPFDESEQRRKALVDEYYSLYPNELYFQYQKDYTTTYGDKGSLAVIDLLHRYWIDCEKVPELYSGISTYTAAGPALLYRSVKSVLARGGKVDAPSTDLKRLSPTQAIRICVNHNVANGIIEDAIVELELLAEAHAQEGNYVKFEDVIKEADQLLLGSVEKTSYRAARLEYVKSVTYGLSGDTMARDRSISLYKSYLRAFDLKNIDVARLN